MSPDRGLVSNVRRLHAQMDKAIQNLADGLEGMEPWQKPNRLKTPVRDLRAYLLTLADLWSKEADLDLRIDLGPGVELPCDPLILKNTMKCLLENAKSVSPPGTDGRFRASLTAERLGKVHPFAEMIRITVRDSGPGIPPRKVPYVFMDGFTDRRDMVEPGSVEETGHKHQGLGLGMRGLFCSGRGENCGSKTPATPTAVRSLPSISDSNPNLRKSRARRRNCQRLSQRRERGPPSHGKSPSRSHWFFQGTADDGLVETRAGQPGSTAAQIREFPVVESNRRRGQLEEIEERLNGIAGR